MVFGRRKKKEKKVITRYKKIKASQKEEQKRAIVNLTISFLVKKLKEIDPKLGKKLEKKIKSKEILIQVLPGKRVLESRITKTKGGAVVRHTTHGLTTTYYTTNGFGRQTNELGHVITLPEAQMFKRGKHGELDLAIEKIPTLIHELIGHTTESRVKGKKVEKGLNSVLKSELRADIMTIEVLKRIQPQMIPAYISGRPIEAVMRGQELRKRNREMEKIRAKEAFARRKPGDLAEKVRIKPLQGKYAIQLKTRGLKKKKHTAHS